MTRPPPMTAEAKANAAARRKKRHRVATVLLQKDFAEADVVDATGLSAESVAVIARQIRHAKLGAQPMWQQLLYGTFRGRNPSPQNPKLPASPPTNACADCIDRFIKYFNAAKRDGTPAFMAVTCGHRGDGTRYSIAYARQGKVPEWVEIGGIDPKDWNEIYFNLSLTNCDTIARIQKAALAKGEQIAAQVSSAHRDRTVIALKLLAIAARVPEHTGQLALAAAKIVTGVL